MNKTVSANIGGFIFHIEEDAFGVLKRYLDAIKSRFSNINGSQEIVEDIEARIAEMLQEKLDGKKQVINDKDVDDIINQMGRPEDIGNEEETTNSTSQNQEYTSSGEQSYTTKRLYRNVDDRILGGVCSGLTAYFGIGEPLWLRLAFLLSFIFFGSGFILYIILWIAMPEAKTTAQKMEMKGEPINLSNIEKTVKEEVDNIKKKFNADPEKSKWHNGLTQLLSAVGEIILRIGNIFVRFASVIISIIAALVFFSLIIAICFGGVSTYAILNSLQSIVFTSGVEGTVFTFSTLAVAFMPLIILIYAVSKLIGTKKKVNLGALGGLALLWLVALFALVGSVFWVSLDFREYYEAETTQVIYTTSDTLKITNPNTDRNPDNANFHFGGTNNFTMQCPDFSRGGINYIDKNGDVLKMSAVNLSFDQTEDSIITLQTSLYSRGGRLSSAKEYAENINFKMSIERNKLTIDDQVVFNKDSKWRGQQVDLKLILPIGKTIYLSRNMEYIIDDFRQFPTYDPEEVINNYWVMTNKGLVCSSCVN